MHGYSTESASGGCPLFLALVAISCPGYLPNLRGDYLSIPWWADAPSLMNSMACSTPFRQASMSETVPVQIGLVKIPNLAVMWRVT